MADTNIKTGAVVTFEVKVGGSVIPDIDRILSIHVEKGINKVPLAKITLLDGDASTATFKTSSSDTFVPGKKITIEAGYDSENKVIFKGIITGQKIQINEYIGSVLIVECRDEAIQMVVGRKSKSFAKKKDSEVISEIIKSYPGLSSKVESTTTKWPEQIQYYVSDWDFILALAEDNGLVVIPIDAKINVQKPDAEKTPVLIIKYGVNLLELNIDLNAITQLDKTLSSTWDFKNQKLVEGNASASLKGPGNLSTKDLSKVINLKEFDLQTAANLLKPDLTTWSEAQIIKSEYSKIIGDVKFQGSPLVDPGKYITLEGTGDRFNGDYLISKVVHYISVGDWITETSLGLPMVWFTEEPDVMAPSTSGLIAGVRGVMNATVKKINNDPDKQYRILVDIPLFDKNGEGVWARMANFYSTDNAGAFFMPEIGDEVVIAFLNEDPRYPVILGSLYSSPKHKPFKGLEPNEKNTRKAIVSKSGIMVDFDDENVVFTVNTPKKNTLILSDKDKKITIKDTNNNLIEMSSSGITLKSDKNINIEASQKVSIKGKMGVSIEAPSGNVEIKGMNIKEKASIEYAAEGGAKAQVKGGANLTLKAAMIMIN